MRAFLELTGGGEKSPAGSWSTAHAFQPRQTQAPGHLEYVGWRALPPRRSGRHGQAGAVPQPHVAENFRWSKDAPSSLMADADGVLNFRRIFFHIGPGLSGITSSQRRIVKQETRIVDAGSPGLLKHPDRNARISQTSLAAAYARRVTDRCLYRAFSRLIAARFHKKNKVQHLGLHRFRSRFDFTGDALGENAHGSKIHARRGLGKTGRRT